LHITFKWRRINKKVGGNFENKFPTPPFFKQEKSRRKFLRVTIIRKKWGHLNVTRNRGWPPTRGDAEAQRNLGWCYRLGQGVGQDTEEAVRHYGLAADQGNASERNTVWAIATNTARGGVEQSWEDAIRYYGLAADQGNASAQYNIALCYERGDGVARDLGEAVRYYRLAADHGDAKAQRNLGACCYHGEGVPQDLE
jgi:uncharacterized protein